MPAYEVGLAWAGESVAESELSLNTPSGSFPLRCASGAPEHHDLRHAANPGRWAHKARKNEGKEVGSWNQAQMRPVNARTDAKEISMGLEPENRALGAGKAQSMLPLQAILGRTVSHHKE